jgi:hypothetical protein
MNEKPKLTENKEAIEAVSIERAAELASEDFGLLGIIGHYIHAIESKAEDHGNFSDVEISEMRKDTEEALIRKKIYFKQSDDGSDPFMSFIQSFQDRAANSIKPTVPPTFH